MLSNVAQGRGRLSRILDSSIKAIDYLSILAGGFAAICIAIQIVVVFYEIVMRSLFNRPTLWSFNLSTYLLIAIGLIGSSYAMLHGSHVSVKIVSSRLPQRVQAILNIVMYTITLTTFLSVLFWLGLKMFMQNLASGSADPFATLTWPLWTVYWIIPVGAFLLILQTISTIYKAVIDLRNLKKTPETADFPRLKGIV